jgi:hypothetical protein
MTYPLSTSLTRLTLALLLLIASGSSAPAEDIQRIFFAERPALLVRIDGEPVYRHMPDTDLERVINTTALIVRDSAGIHYLKVSGGWMEAYQLTGAWTVSGVSPFGYNAAAERTAAASVDRVDGAGTNEVPQTADSATRLDDNPPAIFVATGAATLILTNGTPRYEFVPGTSLQYLANSEATVFREPTDQEIYVRAGDNWYRSWKVDGRWQFIPANELPSDIRRQIGGVAPNGKPGPPRQGER